MTTATGRTCTHIVAHRYIEHVVMVNSLCYAPAVWETDNGARCAVHVGEDENGRRIGVVEGEED